MSQAFNDNCDTARLLLMGLCAGEGIGSTTEFMSPQHVQSVYPLLSAQGWPEKQIGGGPFDWKPGQATDDGDMALSLLRSVIENQGFDPSDAAQALVKWMNSRPRDIGTTTRLALQQIMAGQDWSAPKGWGPRSAGNGSLCRNGVLPAFASTLDEAFEMSLKQSITTHYHPQCVLACSIQSWLLWEMFQEHWPFEYHKDWLKSWHHSFTGWLSANTDPIIRAWLANVEANDVMSEAMPQLLDADFDEDFNPFTHKFAGNGGGAMITLQVAVWLLRMSNAAEEEQFELPVYVPKEVFQRRGGAVLSWVGLIGHDADSYGAAAGPLLAAAHNGEFPTGLTEGLQGLQEFDAIMRAQSCVVLTMPGINH